MRTRPSCPDCWPRTLDVNVPDYKHEIDAREEHSRESGQEIVPAEDADLIAIDVCRTRQGYGLFQDEKTQDDLKAVLAHYCAKRQPEIHHYKQSTNEILAPFCLLQPYPSRPQLLGCLDMVIRKLAPRMSHEAEETMSSISPKAPLKPLHLMIEASKYGQCGTLIDCCYGSTTLCSASFSTTKKSCRTVTSSSGIPLCSRGCFEDVHNVLGLWRACLDHKPSHSKIYFVGLAWLMIIRQKLLSSKFDALQRFLLGRFDTHNPRRFPLSDLVCEAVRLLNMTPQSILRLLDKVTSGSGPSSPAAVPLPSTSNTTTTTKATSQLTTLVARVPTEELPPCCLHVKARDVLDGAEGDVVLIDTAPPQLRFTDGLIGRVTVLQVDIEDTQSVNGLIESCLATQRALSDTTHMTLFAIANQDGTIMDHSHTDDSEAPTPLSSAPATPHDTRSPREPLGRLVGTLVRQGVRGVALLSGGIEALVKATDVATVFGVEMLDNLTVTCGWSDGEPIADVVGPTTPGYSCTDIDTGKDMTVYRYTDHTAQSAREVRVLERLYGCPAVLPVVTCVTSNKRRTCISVQHVKGKTVVQLRDRAKEAGESVQLRDEALASIAREILMQIDEIQKRGLAVLKLTLEDLVAVPASSPDGRRYYRVSLRLPIDATFPRYGLYTQGCLPVGVHFILSCDLLLSLLEDDGSARQGEARVEQGHSARFRQRVDAVGDGGPQANSTGLSPLEVHYCAMKQYHYKQRSQ
ncbi:unnamed protein product [Vitrella brassicaformis CCMP3155]|uniref:Uncharacterized protein n=1 Tax=Vitrella brassicaformis (strain CCMP3155) TaxID=1169540 RepID=A0A0G4FJX7_VITBC|nr:unnamed protein product [Vitrella brassicaformis CCMP3155]|eukprot:CEM14072.1 unnamed protein product [Vitrella brassicaformis CCMP3155]